MQLLITFSLMVQGWLAWLAALLCLFTISNCVTVTLSNVNPRYDASTGEILDAHDGNVLQLMFVVLLELHALLLKLY